MAKISALSSKELDRVFNKGFKKEKDRKEGILKTLKNIEDNNELKKIKNGLDNVKENSFKRLNFINKLGLDSRKNFHKIKKLDKKIDYAKLICVHTNGMICDFNIFRRLGNFIRTVYYADIMLISEETANRQYEMKLLLQSLYRHKQMTKTI